jgi:hypothetical protein
MSKRNSQISLPLPIEGREPTIGKMSKRHYRNIEKVPNRCGGSAATAGKRTRLAASLA